MNGLSSDLQKFAKEEKINSKISRRKEIRQKRQKSMKQKMDNHRKKIIEVKSLLFEDTNKNFKPLAGLIES